MASFHPFMRGGGGRGRHYLSGQSLELWENRPGRPPMRTRINPQPNTGFYKLHVRSIPKGWNETKLRNIFSNAGNVMSLYLNPHGNNNLTWAFIEYQTFVEARFAIEQVNGNIAMDGMVASFARDKVEPDQYYAADDVYGDEWPIENLNSSNRQIRTVGRESPAELPKLTRVIRNDQACSTALNLEGISLNYFDPPLLRRMQEYILQRVINNNICVEPSGKCHVCQSSCSHKCSDCEVFYCSEQCQEKDWLNHRRNCKPVKEDSECGSKTDLAAGGDSRMSNGHSPNVERGSGYSNNRSGESPKYNDRSTTRIGGRGNRNNEREDTRNFNRDDKYRDERGGGRQNDNGKPRNMAEERKARFSAGRQSEAPMMDQKPYQNQNNSNRSSFHDRNSPKAYQSNVTPRTSASPTGASVQSPQSPGEAFLTKEKEFSSKPDASKPWGEVTRPSAPSKTNMSRQSLQSSVLTVGSVEQVNISSVEGSGVYHVMPKKLRDDLCAIMEGINNENGTFPRFAPVKDGICAAEFSGTWSRCQVINLEPLKVKYVDFGNVEELTPERLVTISPELAAKPPCAVKIKLAASTPEAFMKLSDCDPLCIKPTQQLGDYWLCEVPGHEAPSAQTAGPVRTPSSPATQASPSQQTAQDPATVPHKLLPPGCFTEVFVRSRNDTTLGVSPVASKQDVEWLTERLQAEGPIASPIDSALQPSMKCLAKSSQNNKWYRGIIKTLAPLTVYFVDQGNYEGCSEDNLKVLPVSLSQMGPLAVAIRGRDGISDPLFQRDIFAVKRVRKNAGGGWVVDVAEVPQNKTPQATHPIQSTPLMTESSQPVSPQTTIQRGLPPSQATNPLHSTPLMTQSSQPVLPQSTILQELPPPQAANPIHSTPLMTQSSQPMLPQSTLLRELPPSQATNPIQSTPLMTQSSQPVLPQSTILPELPPSQLTPSMAAVPLSRPKPTFPSFLPPDEFTTVVVAFPEPTENGNVDMYYVGTTILSDTIAEMATHFKDCVSHCGQLTPQHGALGICSFEGLYYRVKVIDLSPLRVQYIDFGNIEQITAEQLKRCPDTHKDIPRLVHKIKLAPGTDSKYFNLPFESQLSVKPVSLVSDGTVVVQIQGETYGEPSLTNKAPEMSPTSQSVGLAQTTNEITPVTNVADNPALAETNVLPVTSETSVLTETSCQSPPKLEHPTTTEVPQEQIPVPVVPEQRRCQHVVELLAESFSCSFIPTFMEASQLKGVFNSENIPVEMFLTVNLDEVMENQPHDPNFKPSAGELVACQLQGGSFWFRGKVLCDNLCNLVDAADVQLYSQLKQLPDNLASLPSQAVVLSLQDTSLALLNKLQEKSSIMLTVGRVTDSDGERTVEVRGEIEGATFTGYLRPWNYKPLAMPVPLKSGDKVTICKVLSSNSVMVTPIDNLNLTLQKIQIECRKLRGEELKSPPEVGDYVAFLNPKEDVFYRSQVKSVDSVKNEYVLYNIDLGTQAVGNKADLHPLPTTLSQLPCRATKVMLKGVDEKDLTEQFQLYISDIVTKEKLLTVEVNKSDGSVTLTIAEENENINEKLQILIQPQILPDINGKLTMHSFPKQLMRFGEEVEIVVAQREPLYFNKAAETEKFYHPTQGMCFDMQIYCETETAPYNPCQGEVCCVKFEGEWYRAECLRETNLGISTVMLLEFGNITNIPTSDIRQIKPEFLTLHALAYGSRLTGLPAEISPALKTRLDELLPVYGRLFGVFESFTDGSFNVTIPSIITTLQGEGLV